MHRIFAETSNIVDNKFIIPEEDRFHLGKVIKLKQGEVFQAVVGNYIYDLKYTDYETSEIISKNGISSGVKCKLKLYFGILKGDKTDLIIQKCTELGVTDFYPVMSARTISNVKGKEDSKRNRWQKISDEAGKQSKALELSRVHDPIDFKKAKESLKEENFLIVPYELEESTTLKAALQEYENGDVSIFIGPEGGFEESEITELASLGAKITTLGTKILRAETACISTVANIIYELDLYNGQ